MLGPSSFGCALGALCVSAGLVADGFQFSDAILEHWVGEIGDAVLDGIVKPLEFGVAQFGDVRHPALGAFLAEVENA
jgi:hypothetical protein